MSDHKLLVGPPFFRKKRSSVNIENIRRGLATPYRYPHCDPLVILHLRTYLFFLFKSCGEGSLPPPPQSLPPSFYFFHPSVRNGNTNLKRQCLPNPPTPSLAENEKNRDPPWRRSRANREVLTACEPEKHLFLKIKINREREVALTATPLPPVGEEERLITLSPFVLQRKRKRGLAPPSPYWKTLHREGACTLPPSKEITTEKSVLHPPYWTLPMERGESCTL